MEQDVTRDQINTEAREEKKVETTRLIHRDDLPELCRVVARTLVSYPDRATVLFLQGNLGSGKTTFTQLLAKEIGVVDDVVSPTFVIERRYAVVGEYSFCAYDSYRCISLG
jgi:tRNA threonylcarbamoyl adenosine modification protein YjeE